MVTKESLIVGLEINKKYCNIGYYGSDGEIITIDTSGGYGKGAFPSVVLYNKVSDEWIFGESAVNSDIYEDTTIFNSILDIASVKDNYINIDGKTIATDYIIKEFLTEIMEALYNINPRGVVEKITIYYENCKEINCNEIFKKSFELIGINESKINFVTLDNIIFNSIKIMEKDDSFFEVLCLSNENSFYATESKSKVYSNLNYSIIEERIYNYLENVYKEKFSNAEITTSIQWKIKSLIYHNKELIYNKYLNQQNCKVYMNFCYPAIQCKILYEDMKKMFSTFNLETTKFKGNNIYVAGMGVDLNLITKKILNNKNWKKIDLINSIVFISRYGLDEKVENFNKESKHIIKNDIGVKIIKNNKEIFYPIVKKGMEMPIDKQSLDFYIKENINEKLYIIKKEEKVEKNLCTLPLKNIKRFSRVSISIEFIDIDNIKVQLIDKGLGEMIKKSNYNVSLLINLG